MVVRFPAGPNAQEAIADAETSSSAESGPVLLLCRWAMAASRPPNRPPNRQVLALADGQGDPVGARRQCPCRQGRLIRKMFGCAFLRAACGDVVFQPLIGIFEPVLSWLKLSCGVHQHNHHNEKLLSDRPHK
jgi:hypothetical protein